MKTVYNKPLKSPSAGTLRSEAAMRPLAERYAPEAT